MEELDYGTDNGWPPSRAQSVSFGNMAMQDVIRASTWRFPAGGVPSAQVGCLLPTGASKGSGVPFARLGCLRSLTCSGPLSEIAGTAINILMATGNMPRAGLAKSVQCRIGVKHRLLAEHAELANLAMPLHCWKHLPNHAHCASRKQLL